MSNEHSEQIEQKKKTGFVTVCVTMPDSLPHIPYNRIIASTYVTQTTPKTEN